MIAASSVLENEEQTTKIIQMQQQDIMTTPAAWCQHKKIDKKKYKNKKQAIFNKYHLYDGVGTTIHLVMQKPTIFLFKTTKSLTKESKSKLQDFSKWHGKEQELHKENC